VACDLGKGVEGLELVSLHSVSKGIMGECGKRGGYMEVIYVYVYIRMCVYVYTCAYVFLYI
jgi:alanine transaminase